MDGSDASCTSAGRAVDPTMKQGVCYLIWQGTKDEFDELGDKLPEITVLMSVGQRGWWKGAFWPQKRERVKRMKYERVYRIDGKTSCWE